MAVLDQVPFLKRMLEMGYTIALVVLISGIVGLVLAYCGTLFLGVFILLGFYRHGPLMSWQEYCSARKAVDKIYKYPFIC